MRSFPAMVLPGRHDAAQNSGLQTGNKQRNKQTKQVLLVKHTRKQIK